MTVLLLTTKSTFLGTSDLLPYRLSGEWPRVPASDYFRVAENGLMAHIYCICRGKISLQKAQFRVSSSMKESLKSRRAASVCSDLRRPLLKSLVLTTVSLV